jgi:hypothetical protein
MLKKFCTNSQSRPAGAAHLRRKPPRRRYGAGDPLSSCYRALAGAERGFGCCPPSNKARRRYEFRTRTSSGEANPNRSWCLPPVSALLNGVGLFGIRLPPATGMLAGAERGFGCCPPANEGSPEVRISHSPSSGETNPNRSWCLPPVSALLNGVGLFGIRLPPASECWPELSADSHAVLRRTKAPRRYEFRCSRLLRRSKP